MIRQPSAVRTRIALGGLLTLLLLAGCSARSDSPPAVGRGVTTLSSRVAAPVAAVLVEDQQQVAAGALLVQLDAVPLRAALERQQLELEVARATLEQARVTARA